MSIQKNKVDAVIIGFGWTGAIMAKELTDAGLHVVALERGEYQDTNITAQYPKIADELAYSVRGKLFQHLASETVTVRHNENQTAVPYRQHGSFLLGNGVGGAGFHWNGMHWRALESDLNLRSHYEQRYGKSFIPKGMTIQDFGVTYQELEPYFMHFETVCGVSGAAGNINGTLIDGGNKFEGPRSKAFPLPPLADTYGASLFAKAAKQLGYHPFPVPASNASEPYTNPYNVRLGPCNFCGFCENYGCYMYSKASPQTTILPALRQSANFELRTGSHVIKINLDSTGKKATGVTYIDAQGQEIEQTADLVILSAFQMHNVRLLLLSKIGQPYDPKTGEGVVGKNFCYQMNGNVSVVLPKGTQLNAFAGAGAGGQAIDDFNGDNFDHSSLGFIGGAEIWHNRTGARPIKQAPTLPNTPAWGKEWKTSIQDAYQRVTTVATHGSVMAYEDCYLDLDPTYKDSFGLPLLRMTFDWHENELKMTQFTTKKAEEIGKAMGAESFKNNAMPMNAHYDVRFYQSTHLTGGAIMGTNPKNSVVNKFLQSWDVSNLFVLGASSFPQNFGYNPTGLVGALAYHAAHAIREQYLKNPGPLVQA
ncbi:GMC family oxidoreductase [Neisseria sp. Ec49-e6-T10]|uniref:GMC family oxidoreductase n=1 Tax=Neisseria sp. Ec49-e6-T10 TaxID=3140744 RepID=UPI003EBCA553